MQITAISLTVLSPQPLNSARFYTQHFGFTPSLELDWFVSLQHPAHPALHLDLLRQGHAAAGQHLQGQQTTGVMLALVTEDVTAEAQRLTRAGLSLLMPVTEEPWGQKRFQVQGPDGVVVELLEFTAPDPAWLAQQAENAAAAP